jgi:hypothetical protein
MKNDETVKEAEDDAGVACMLLEGSEAALSSVEIERIIAENWDPQDTIYPLADTKKDGKQKRLREGKPR